MQLCSKGKSIPVNIHFAHLSIRNLSLPSRATEVLQCLITRFLSFILILHLYMVIIFRSSISLILFVSWCYHKKGMGYIYSKISFSSWHQYDFMWLKSSNPGSVRALLTITFQTNSCPTIHHPIPLLYLLLLPFQY